MRIRLIQPPKPAYGAEAEEHWQITRPFSLLFLSGYLHRQVPQHDVEVLDFQQRRSSPEEVESCLRDLAADIIGITATTYTRFEAIRIARLAKRYLPDACVIVGGVHFMYCAEDTLAHVSEIDMVVRGEGELTFLELVEALDSDGDIGRVDGITYRCDGRIVATSDRTLYEDLDALPMDAGYAWDDYPEYLLGTEERVKAASVMTSRGCPYQCVFCSKAGMKYRVRTPVRVVDELETLQQRLGVDAFNFVDLTFTAHPRHVEEVCDEIVRRGLDIKWWCESRANISLELLDRMKAAGCAVLALGVESGSPRILSSISKGITVDQVVAFCRRASELGMLVTPFFMFSHVDETPEDVEQTLDLVRTLERFTAPCSFQPTLIFPGTQLERIARERGVLPVEFSWSEPYESELNREVGQLANVPIYLERLTAAQLNAFVRRKRAASHAMQFTKMSLGGLLRKVASGVASGKVPIGDLVGDLVSPAFYRAMWDSRTR